jgi:hypothetical protein
MEQINAQVKVDVTRLHFPLRPFYARQGHNFVAVFEDVPADMSGVFVRIFKANGEYFDVTAVEHLSGLWSVKIPGGCFPEVGTFKYELHALSSDLTPAALGEGVLNVASFSVTSAAIEPGTQQPVALIPCEGGGYVQTVMTFDGYEWVLKALPNTETIDA